MNVANCVTLRCFRFSVFPLLKINYACARLFQFLGTNLCLKTTVRMRCCVFRHYNTSAHALLCFFVTVTTAHARGNLLVKICLEIVTKFYTVIDSRRH